jgi:hypothetical protein
MENIWMQLILTGGTAITAMFFTIRYAIKETNKGKDNFLDYLKDMQEQQLQYYENKNGHLERISKEFSKTIIKNTKAIDNLALQLSKKKK